MSLLYAMGVAILLAIAAFLIMRSTAGPQRHSSWEYRSLEDTEARRELAIQREIDMEVAEALAAESMVRDVPDNVTEMADYQARRQPDSRGVKLSPPRPALGRDVTVRYRGTLSDATLIFLRVGYGSEEWDGIEDIPLTNDGGVWKATFRVSGISRLNMCFRDGLGNWDNNEGQNWSWDVLL